MQPFGSEIGSLLADVSLLENKQLMEYKACWLLSN